MELIWSQWTNKCSMFNQANKINNLNLFQNETHHPNCSQPNVKFNRSTLYHILWSYFMCKRLFLVYILFSCMNIKRWGGWRQMLRIVNSILRKLMNEKCMNENIVISFRLVHLNSVHFGIRQVQGSSLLWLKSIYSYI